MKFHKLIVRFVYGVIGISILIVVALMIFQQQQIKKMGESEAPIVSKNKPPAEIPGNTEDIKTNPRDTLYAVLFEKLALSPEKQAAFKAILLDLSTKTTDLNMEMLDTSISEEKREEIQQQLKTATDESNHKIREILGPDNFKKYLTYEEKMDERTLLTLFFRSLPRDEKLSEAQEQAFIDAMFEERKKAEAASPQDNEAAPQADLEMQASQVMKTVERIHSGYMKVAGNYLSPSQTEQFVNFLHQRRDMMEVSLNAMRQVFGDNATSDTPRTKPDAAAN